MNWIYAENIWLVCLWWWQFILIDSKLFVYWSSIVSKMWLLLWWVILGLFYEFILLFCCVVWQSDLVLNTYICVWNGTLLLHSKCMEILAYFSISIMWNKFIYSLNRVREEGGMGFGGSGCVANYFACAILCWHFHFIIIFFWISRIETLDIIHLYNKSLMFFWINV